jgi:hypothetical protein
MNLDISSVTVETVAGITAAVPACEVQGGFEADHPCTSKTWFCHVLPNGSEM